MAEEIMTIAELELLRRLKAQILIDQAKAKTAEEARKQEDHWVADIIANLVGFVRKIG
jgi:hypothetical protein